METQTREGEISIINTTTSSSPPPLNNNHHHHNNPNPTRLTQLFKFSCGGAKPIPLLLCISTGLITRFAVPKPDKLTSRAWQLLSFFIVTITGLILAPLPVGSWAFVCLTLTLLTKTLSFQESFVAATNEVIWLIVVAFFFSRGFVKSGLGDRVSAYFVKWLGKRTVGLAYGLVLGEALVAPAIPSSTARAGGVFCPVIQSVAKNCESFAGDNKSSRKLASFLILSQMQSACNSSALFLTAAAQNLLCLKLAEQLGVMIGSPWVSWFKIASIPAAVALLLTPLILYTLYPPELKDTPDAPAMAAEKLKNMGPVTKNEWVMVATMLLAVSLWVFGDRIGVSSVVAAMLGLSLLLLMGVLEWDDCLSEKSAWDTLAWFTVLVGMASQLTNLGIVSWMSNCVANALKAMHVSWPVAFAILEASYFFVHYLFASQTAHVGALYSAFLAMHLASGVPGVLAALALAYNTNLFGALAHYSSGQAAVYYGGCIQIWFDYGGYQCCDLDSWRGILVEDIGTLLKLCKHSSSLSFCYTPFYRTLVTYTDHMFQRLNSVVNSVFGYLRYKSPVQRISYVS